MADEPPKKASDRFSSWKKAAQKNQVSSVGESNDVVKKAMAVNPALKGSRTTDELSREVAEVRRTAAAKDAAEKETRPKISLVSDPTAVPKVDPRNLVALVEATKEWVAAEQKRVSEARERARVDAAALANARSLQVWETRDKLIALLLSVDPALASLKTQALLDGHAAWLKSIGFQREMLNAPPERPR